MKISIEVFNFVGLLNIPAAIHTEFVPITLKKILAPQLLQNPLLALFEDLNHFNDFLDKNFNKILNLKSNFIINAILNSCLLKKKIIEKDEKEKNL